MCTPSGAPLCLPTWAGGGYVTRPTASSSRTEVVGVFPKPHRAAAPAQSSSKPMTCGKSPTELREENGEITSTG
jgi:hypothetical protein